MLSGRGLCDELITHPEESYRRCCVVVCDIETSRMGAPYIYDISRLRGNQFQRHFYEKWLIVIIDLLGMDRDVMRQYQAYCTKVTRLIKMCLKP